MRLADTNCTNPSAARQVAAAVNALGASEDSSALHRHTEALLATLPEQDRRLVKELAATVARELEVA